MEKSLVTVSMAFKWGATTWAVRMADEGWCGITTCPDDVAGAAAPEMPPRASILTLMSSKENRGN